MRGLPQVCRVIAYGLFASAMAAPLVSVLWYGMTNTPA
jgi:hypothetical protein